MALEIPAYCPTCRALYPSGIVLGEGASATLLGNVSNCPRGHTTQVLEGTMEVRDGVLHVQRQRIEKIKRLALKAVSGKTDAEEALKAIEVLAPSLAPVIKVFGKNKVLLAIALLAWFAVEMTKALHPGGGSPQPIHIENRPTIINQISTPQTAPSGVHALPTPDKTSKRKKRRLRGKQHSGRK